jgi:hypothetical protein
MEIEQEIRILVQCGSVFDEIHWFLAISLT